MRKLIEKLPRRFRYTLHNLIGHPLMEIAYLLGMRTLADKIHDSTLPSDKLEFSEEYLQKMKNTKELNKK